jgi:uncharacterized protein (DUF697 family)
VDRLGRSKLTIHGAATLAAGWSALMGGFPVTEITGDTAGLVAICTAMGGSLAVIFGRKLSDLGFMGFVAAAGQYFAGALAIKVAASFVPGFGNWVNATVSFGTVQIMGWAIYLILKDDKDPTTLDKRQVKDYLGRARKLKDEFKAHGTFDWMDRLPPDVKARMDVLLNEHAKEDTSPVRREEIMAELEILLKPHRPQDDD